jgi:hypothetical protein
VVAALARGLLAPGAAAGAGADPAEALAELARAASGAGRHLLLLALRAATCSGAFRQAWAHTCGPDRAFNVSRALRRLGCLVRAWRSSENAGAGAGRHPPLLVLRAAAHPGTPARGVLA